ncbi:MAG TPA: FAD-dependent monooxygenase [Nocardia sp.]|uniref:FAD-dependent monooxygenase n=1 Tax=Nocardia sp. TaxID=1821 RepID=UPI002B4B5A95|nr:FAD-dependent monooxygenase [Nocardia sp.]HLS76080.1 FAD-dependent monooxygenase [Nocardia sp.]
MSAIRSALVVGGGIAGPVVATALRKAGIDASVHEAYPGPSEGIGSGLALAPNGLAALDLLGAGEAVRAVAAPVACTVLAVGGRMHRLPVAAGEPPLRLVDRAALHTVLHEHARAAGVPVHYGSRLVGAEERADGVTARFADGTTASADILVGADGIRSTVRTLIDPDAPGPEYTGMLGFGATVDCPVPVPPETMVFAYGRRAYYLYWRDRDGRVGWGANLPHREYLTLAQARQVAPERWLEILRETYGADTPGGELVRGTSPEQLEITGGLHIMPPVPRWFSARTVLVGDAVHAPSNSSGQGASLAVESAVQLARCLRDLPDPVSAFAAYERLRRERVEGIAARAARINRSKTPGPVGRTLMNLLMPLMVRTVMKPGERTAAERGYRIDWDAPVSRETTAA